MNNREIREYKKSLHLYLAFNRKNSNGKKVTCIRHVIKGDEKEELKIFKSKLLNFNCEFRIHRTVNARDVEKARIHLLKKLIEYPEKGAYVDTEWRTSLLQKECKATKYFMLDIDTQEKEKIFYLEGLIPKSIRLNFDKPNYIMYSTVRNKFKSPNGWHYITLPFDTREICKLDYVTLLRDGYYYVKTVGEV